MISKLCFDIEFRSYLDQMDYYSLLKSSHLNLYIRNENTFHHKVFELIAARRAVICYPAETAEVVSEARKWHSPFYSCSSAEDILKALNKASTEREKVNSGDIFQLDWNARAIDLETIFLSYTTRSAG